MADQSASARHDRIEEQLRRIRSDMALIRQQDVAILRLLVCVKRTVEDIGQGQPSPSRHQLRRSLTVNSQSQRSKRSLGGQNSNPVDGNKTTTQPRYSDDAEDHFVAYHEGDGSDDDNEQSPLSRSYSSEGARSAALGGDGGEAEQQQLSKTQTERSWLSSSFYEEMLRRNVKIWKTVELINTGRCNEKGVKLWS